jgi:peptidoglycan biosynthesis protein MviN/MurJ (putative lipid II flippase)
LIGCTNACGGWQWINVYQQKVITIISAVELTLNITLAVILFPLLGLKGIVLAIVLANFIEKLILLVYLKLNLGISPSTYIPFPIYISYSIFLMMTLSLKLMY